MQQTNVTPAFGAGFIAVAQVANHHGVQVAPSQLSHQMAVGDASPTAEDLARAAIMVGLRAKIVRDPSARRLRTLPVPAIMKLKDGGWAVLGVETAQERHRVIDPVSRRQESLPIEEILDRLDHDVILIGKSGEVAAEAEKFGIGWFVPALKRYRKPLVHVLIASFFINLLGLGTPLCFQLLIDDVLTTKSFSTLLVVISALLLIAVFSTLLQFLRSYAINHTSNRIDVELGAKLYAHLIRLPIAYFERRSAGVIVTRAREIENVRRFMTDQGLPSVMDLMFIFIYVGVLYYYSRGLTLAILLLIPCYIVIGASLRPAYRRKQKDKFRRWAKTQQLVVETVVGIQTLKAAAVEAVFQKMWETRHSAYIKTSFESIMMGTAAQTSVQFITRLQTALILFFGTQQAVAGTMTVGQLIAFSMISQRMNQPILRCAQLYQSFQEVEVSLEHLGDILDTPIEQNSQALTILAAPRGAIDLRHVSFRYRPDLPLALKGIDLSIAPGEVIGIVGPSGSGKSTLTKLIQRFHAPTAGEILIDGIDIADVDPAWLRRQLGVVLQENFLFNQTVHDNIALAKPEMTRFDVVRCARLAGADEFVSKMLQGYDSTIEERGANLSGGQRQRIAIARALATDPRILILDEATSALDYDSERIIQANMDQMAQGRTVIIIAHRLAAVRHCHRIVGMINGEIVEIGTHDELLRRRNGLYAHLWALQTDQVVA